MKWFTELMAGVAFIGGGVMITGVVMFIRAVVHCSQHAREQTLRVVGDWDVIYRLDMQTGLLTALLGASLLTIAIVALTRRAVG